MPNEVGVVCVLWGDKYSSRDVARLKSAWDRHGTSLPFYCLTDETSQLVSLPDVRPILSPYPWHGWWQKVALFKKDLIPSRHLILFDLDVVIKGSLLPLVSLVGKYELVHATDPIDRLSSSFLIIDTHSRLAEDITHRFDPETWVKPDDGDQDYLRLFIGDPRYLIRALPPKDHYSYKCLTNTDDWKKRATTPHYSARWSEIVMLNFHGYPKPSDLEANPERFPLAKEILEEWR